MNPSSYLRKGLFGYTNPFGYTDVQLYHNGALTNQELYNYNTNGQVAQRNSLASSIHSNLKLQYDYAGRLNSVGTGVQDNNYFYTGYRYTIERVTKVQTNGQQSYSGADKDNATYEYCPDGKIKKITYPKLNDNSYLTTEDTYNPLGIFKITGNRVPTNDLPIKHILRYSRL